MRANPAHTEAHTLLGVYYDQKGTRDQAITHYETALRLNANLPQVKLRLAALYGGVGRVDDGLARAREVAAAEPKDASSRVVLGELYLRKGDFPQAVQAFAKAAEIQPDLAAAHLGLGMALQQNGERDRAVAAYRKVMALAPNDSRAYNNLAWMYAEQKREPRRSPHPGQARDRAGARTSGAVPRYAGLGPTTRAASYAEAEPVLRKAAELGRWRTPRSTITWACLLTSWEEGRGACSRCGEPSSSTRRTHKPRRQGGSWRRSAGRGTRARREVGAPASDPEALDAH